MNIKSFIPNGLTSANVFCGMLALVFISTDQLIPAIIVVALALIFDFFDGFAARLLKVNSPMGKELDSLADMVTFGIVPAFIMAKLIQESQGLSFLPSNLSESSFLWMFGLFVGIFSALRLAKFNVDERQSDSFYGLPTPANCMLIFSYWIITELYPEYWLSSILNNTWLLIGLSLVSSFLLVAELRLISLKFKNFSFQDNIFRYLLIGISLILFAFMLFKSIPFIIFTYILLSIIENLQKR